MSVRIQIEIHRLTSWYQIATHHPSTAADDTTAALETRRQKQARDFLIANMDPALKAYLDKMSDDTVARANKQDDDSKAILKAVATQTARIDALVSWKPELEARFAQLESAVATLQAASSALAPTPPSTDPRRLQLHRSRARSKGNQATARHCNPGDLRRRPSSRRRIPRSRVWP